MENASLSFKLYLYKEIRRNISEVSDCKNLEEK